MSARVIGLKDAGRTIIKSSEVFAPKQGFSAGSSRVVGFNQTQKFLKKISHPQFAALQRNLICFALSFYENYSADACSSRKRKT
jgi:hypothetical protein